MRLFRRRRRLRRGWEDAAHWWRELALQSCDSLCHLEEVGFKLNVPHVRLIISVLLGEGAEQADVSRKLTDIVCKLTERSPKAGVLRVHVHISADAVTKAAP